MLAELLGLLPIGGIVDEPIKYAQMMANSRRRRVEYFVLHCRGMSGPFRIHTWG